LRTLALLGQPRVTQASSGACKILPGICLELLYTILQLLQALILI
jgi:hypothetical protein